MQDTPVFKFAIREDLLDTGDLFLPKKSEPFATGWDVRAAFQDKKDLVIKPGQYFKIQLGFRMLPPEGWWAQLNPRSSSFAKKHMHNLIGIIDEHYSQEVLFAGQFLPDVISIENELVIKYGDSIGQIVPFQRQEMIVDSINNKEYNDLCNKRKSIRSGGFGSTG